ncbi:MerR family transcriptional regulator [Streptomyces nigrescens]|uniref:MerR family transcriptional regulator n=2 Tax=Streptomyces TaxID=1883 RepID=A0ABM7ZU86_STRNI|nr:MerR family transcriptional regulator [Streptomyces nigrescens]MEE4417749.1 MerR family transcriptional regulator [Streptomyces sp. DSM 41528]BDM69925.1 MerR family transcriptional regulator [Streptomyces nigrescens]
MSEDTWTIGQLAARTGLPVKTVRYYSDVGLLPVAERSAGGHRRYRPEALEQLHLVQRLRALDTPISTITQLASGERSLGDLIADEMGLVRSRLTELHWRQATLEALDDCSAQERLRRLEVLSRVQRLPESQDRLAGAWRQTLPASVPARLVDAITAQAVPELPENPTAEVVLAYAELHTLIRHQDFPVYWACPSVRDKASLYSKLLDTCELAADAVADGLPPQPGEVLDYFSRACARLRGEDDTPGFRTFMAAQLHGIIPLFRRYWQHVATISAAQRPNLGITHCWLVESLTSREQAAPAPAR